MTDATQSATPLPQFTQRAEPAKPNMDELAQITRRILQARIYDLALETPLDLMPQLSKKLGHTVLLKREDLQPVFSFKLRGAYNKIRQLPKDLLEKGIICASAGNHAQGVAMSAQKLGIRAVIVMPATTPEIKVASVAARGAEVVLIGDAFDQALQHAMTLVEKENLTFIHPYDDDDIIAGQGTTGMEILRQAPENLHAVFVPIGGGGLASGVAAYIKYLQPNVRVIGVESCDAASMQAALAANDRVALESVGIFADGVAVKQVGTRPFEICLQTLDDVITITPDEMCAGIKDIFEATRCISEPSGALAVAGLKKYLNKYNEAHAEQALTCVAISSGANMNFDRLRHITERTAIGEGREALFAVSIPEQIGSFRTLCRLLSRYSISEFNYRAKANDCVSAEHNQQSKQELLASAHIFLGLQIKKITDRQVVADYLREHGYKSIDLSDNEVARVHLRHMVGGRASQMADEYLYRFEFPERPGALMQFLEELGQRWNISLFHYRNHGTDYGRVLAGFNIPHNSINEFAKHLNQLGYRYFDESDNPAYTCFLS